MLHEFNAIDGSIGKTLQEMANSALDDRLNTKTDRKRRTRGEITAAKKRMLAVEFAGDACQKVEGRSTKR